MPYKSVAIAIISYQMGTYLEYVTKAMYNNIGYQEAQRHIIKCGFHFLKTELMHSLSL